MIQDLFQNLNTAVVVIIFFGVTILVHEFGHYVAARLCGLVVHVFSIGFGPAVWKRKVGGITYKIGWLPFGGYVALPQLDPAGMSRIQGSENGDSEPSLPPVTPWRKILVSFSGAAGNILLAVCIAWLVYLIGMPATTANQDTVVGHVDPKSSAYEAGLRVGDEILAVNGIGVDKWSQFIQESSLYDQVNLDVRAEDGTHKEILVETEEWRYGARMVWGVDCRNRCIVGKVAEGMSAEKAGIEEGDVIVAIAGRKVLSTGHLVDLVSAYKDQTVPVTVERQKNGETVLETMMVTPAYDEATKMTRIGIVFSREALSVDTSISIHPRPLDQLRFHAGAIFRVLASLVSPQTAGQAAKMVGGPVAIITQYVQIIRASIMLALWFTGFLNVNLAIINLLPIPVLDGGHIVFSLWETVTRRPVNARVANALVNAFAVLIIGLFVLLSLRDLDRFTPAGRFVRRFFGGDAEAAGSGLAEGDPAQPSAAGDQ